MHVTNFGQIHYLPISILKNFLNLCRYHLKSKYKKKKSLERIVINQTTLKFTHSFKILRLKNIAEKIPYAANNKWALLLQTGFFTSYHRNVAST